MREFVLKQLPALLMLAALTTNMKQMQWLCRMIAFAGAMMVVLSLRFGGYVDNRLTLPGTSLGNPNDFATHLLLILPFCVWLIFSSSWAFKIVGVVSSGALGLIVLRSGSRGGFLTLIAMIAVIFWKSSGGQRLAIVAVCVAGTVLAVSIFPQVLWNRFETIYAGAPPANVGGFGDDSSETVAVAESSTNARWYILKRSVEFTLQNPLFGLGPGNFAIKEADLAHGEGRRGSWIGTHNSYTQASSEGGIPAFLFFAATLFSAMRINAGIHKRTRNRPELRNISRTALCLLVTIAGFSVNILFSHLAFRFYVPMLVGMTIAFSVVVEQEMTRRAPASV